MKYNIIELEDINNMFIFEPMKIDNHVERWKYTTFRNLLDITIDLTKSKRTFPTYVHFLKDLKNDSDEGLKSIKDFYDLLNLFIVFLPNNNGELNQELLEIENMLLTDIQFLYKNKISLILWLREKKIEKIRNKI